MRFFFVLAFLLPFTLLACSDDTVPVGPKTEASVGVPEAGPLDAGACPTAEPTENGPCTFPSFRDCVYHVTNPTNPNCSDGGPHCTITYHYRCEGGKWVKTVYPDASI